MTESMREEVLRGLRLPQKALSPKYFYDQRGSELFEEITCLPEYYPTRTERGLLERWSPVWMKALRPRTLVELGAGSARKTRILLDAMSEGGAGALFVPVDVSEEFLHATADRIREEYPGIEVEPEVADISAPLVLSADPPSPAVFALLGSTIGNFDEPAAVRLLRHVRATMGADDVFLMGADLRPGPAKPVELLEAAYNDSRGVTAEFNRNVLRVLNREIGTDFDPGAFRHRAFYDPDEERIEMHLVAEGEQTVAVPGAGSVSFADGESVLTEISCKYDRPTVERLYAAAGLELAEWREDEGGLYALTLARPAGAAAR